MSERKTTFEKTLAEIEEQFPGTMGVKPQFPDDEPSPSALAPDGASTVPAQLRACVTASGGIDLRDPALLFRAAALIEGFEEELKHLAKLVSALPAQGRPGPSDKQIGAAVTVFFNRVAQGSNDIEAMRAALYAATPSPVEGRPSELAAKALHLAGRLRAPNVLYDGFLREDTAQTLERLAALLPKEEPK